MSLVENLINQISTSSTGGITKPQGFDINDDTFAKLLQKQLEEQENQVKTPTNSVGEMGIPLGLNIEPFEGISGINTEDVAIMNNDKTIEFKNTSEPDDFIIKDLDMSDYFSNYLRDMSHSKSDIMTLAVKHASKAYNFFEKNEVVDLEDFAQDISNLIKK
ncbi:MAG: hypothetical protein MJ231_03085 [bacterium]|nr:hypothetical protein [bacterium]